MLIQCKYFWDGISDVIQENISIEIDDRKIIKIDSSEYSDPTFKIAGLVMPGLIDSHIHMVLDGSANPMKNFLRLNKDDLRDIAYKNLQEQLQSGVTLVREMGCPFDIDIDISKESKPYLPKVMPSGTNLCIPKGHAWWLGKELSSIHTAIETTKSLILKGANHIKIMATGGIITEGVEPGSAELSPIFIKAICNEANNFNIPVVSHAQGEAGILNSLENGVRYIEHGFEITEKMAFLFKEKTAILTPTFSAVNSIINNIDKVPEFMKQKLQPQIKKHKNSFNLALDHNITILAGTDGGTPFNRHGNILHEIGYLIENGMNPFDSFRSATSIPAQKFRTNKGILKAGFDADIIAFDKNIIHEFDPDIRPILIIREGHLCLRP